MFSSSRTLLMRRITTASVSHSISPCPITRIFRVPALGFCKLSLRPPPRLLRPCIFTFQSPTIRKFSRTMPSGPNVEKEIANNTDDNIQSPPNATSFYGTLPDWIGLGILSSMVGAFSFYFWKSAQKSEKLLIEWHENDEKRSIEIHGRLMEMMDELDKEVQESCKRVREMDRIMKAKSQDRGDCRK